MKKWNLFNILNKSNNESQSDINQPSNNQHSKNIDNKINNNNKNNINNPSTTNIPEKDPNRKFKIGIIIFSSIIGVGLIAGIITSFLGTGPRQLHLKEVHLENTVDDNKGGDKDKIILVSKTGQQIPIDENLAKKAVFYRETVDSIRITIGNNFTGFYIQAKIEETDLGPAVSFGQYMVTSTLIHGDKGLTNIFTKKLTTNDNQSQSGQPQKPSEINLVAIYPKDGNGNIKKDGGILGNMLLSFSNNLSFQPAGFDWSIIINLLPIVISIIFFILIFRMMRGAGQGGAGQESVFSIGKSQAKIAQSTVKFTDVAGIQEEKNELIEIVDYLKRPEKYVAMGARVPKGVILYGPPGTGKTLLAKAVAGEAGVPFFQVSGSAFEDMLVGVGAKRVRDLFSKAVKASPAIIFIDEIDSVGSKRGKLETTSGSLADQTLNQLLAEMDGFSSRSGVVVIAATNRLDVLDDALLRPGRFDRHIQVNLPDIKERTQILEIHAKNKNLSSSVDLEDISRRTPGFSGAQLENVLNEATLLAVRKNKNSINTEDLDEAIDRVIAGPAKKSRVISAEEKKQIAYHEAGHALVGLHIKGGDVVQKITIIPRGQAAGYTLSVPEIQELQIQKKSDLLGMVASTLGGRASEEIIYGKESVSTGAANDLYKVTNVVRAMVMQLGMSDLGMTQFAPSEGAVNPYQQKLYSETTALSIDKEVDKIIRKQYEVASDIIKKNKKELDLIVESLLLLETIVKPQIDYIHKNLKLPQEALDKKKELESKKEKKLNRKDEKPSEKTENTSEKDIKN